MTREPKLVFTKEALPLILEALGKTTDEKGFIIDIKTKEFQLDIWNSKIKAEKLIGIVGDKWLSKPIQICDIAEEINNKQGIHAE